MDFTRSARRIRDRLRAFTPWPGAATTLDGRTVKLLEAAEAPAAGAAPDAPGSAAVVPGRGLAVRCGDGTALLVTRLQPEGKPPQAAVDFANGLRRRTLTFGT